MEDNIEKRPWGCFEVLFYGEKHKVKRLIINPQCRTSLQTHSGHEELLLVTSGEAIVEINGTELIISKNQECKIAVGNIHRLANRSVCIPAEIIEFQYGDYLSEDDIVRLEDDFGRV